MPSNTLFEPPAGFTKRIAELQELGVRESRLLLQVELGFALMEKLGLDDEPVTAVWAILSGMFIKYPELQNLSAEDRRAIANVRQIVPFSARFNWLSALRDYKRRIPEDWRNYDFNLQELDNQKRIGLWRASYLSASTEIDAMRYLNKIIHAYLDKGAPDRIHAAESLETTKKSMYLRKLFDCHIKLSQKRTRWSTSWYILSI